MRKGIVILIVAVVVSCDVFSQSYGVLPTAKNNCPTVIITQKDYDTLLVAFNKSTQMELIAKEEAEKMFSNYIEHIGGLIGLFGILVGLLGVFLPYKTNEIFMKEINSKINKMNEDISSHNEKIELSNKNMAGFDEKFVKYNQRIAISFATQAYSAEKIDVKITLITAAISIDPENCEFYNFRSRKYFERGKDDDYNLAMKDIITGLSLNPDESTRKMLERNMEELKAKMQQPKEGE